LLAGACGDSDDEAATSDSDRVELTRVSIGTGIGTPVLSISNAFVLPEYLGFWEEEGLDVDLQPNEGGSGGVIQALEVGNLDVGHAGAAPLPAAIASGIDLVAFFVEHRQNYHWPAVLPGSEIEEPEDLVGKKIGVHSLTAASVAYTKEYISRAGGDPAKIEFVAVGVGADAAEALKAGHVDAIVMWAHAYVGLESVGYEFRYLPDLLEEMGFQTVTFAKRDFVEDPANHDTLVGLARGMAKAMIFAAERPDCAVRALWDVYPEARPTGISEEQALKNGITEMEANAKYEVPADDGRWGDATHDEVALFLKVLSSDLDVDDIWTDELIEEINDFDHDAIREMAEDFECG
ncbi:MAG: ABC transporter substrate-binding protein, partial [Acidimicrobiia bacterium]